MPLRLLPSSTLLPLLQLLLLLLLLMLLLMLLLKLLKLPLPPLPLLLLLLLLLLHLLHLLLLLVPPKRVLISRRGFNYLRLRKVQRDLDPQRCADLRLRRAPDHKGPARHPHLELHSWHRACRNNHSAGHLLRRVLS